MMKYASRSPQASFPLVLLFATLVLASPVVARSADAVGFRGPGRDGVFPGRLPRRRPSVVWSFPTEGPINASPVWVGGLVVVGSGDGSLYAVDAATGRQRWRFRTGGAVDAPAACAEGNVIAASRDGNLYAVDARSGREKWRLPLGAELPFPWGWDFFLSGAAVEGSRLFVGSGSGELLAVDAATGTVAWRFATGGRVRSSPTVSRGVVYVGSFDGFVYAIDAASGALRWKFATRGVTINLEQAGFDRRSVQGSPAVTEDFVVVGGRDGHLYAIDRRTGAERWNFDHRVSWVVGSPAVAGGRAIVGSSDGRFVQAVDLATGQETWRTGTDGNALSSPAVAGDVVVLGEAAGSLLGLDLSTGRELWRFVTGDAVHSSPLVRDGRVYVGSDDGKLYALAGDLEAPAGTALRAVYFDARLPYRHFPGDRDLRDVLAAESYQTLDRRNVAEFLEARIADRMPSVVVFSTDIVPTTLVDESKTALTLVRRYLDAGGKVVWPGSLLPFLYSFDPATGMTAAVSLKDLERTRRILGVEHDNLFEGECRAQATELGRRWGLPGGWWIGEDPITPARGSIEVLASDEHGHAAAWVRRFGGPEGTGFVRYWGREKRLPDPRVVLALAEYGLP